MEIIIRATRTNDIVTLLRLDPKSHDFRFLQIGNNVTHIQYGGENHMGDIEVYTDSIRIE